MIDDPTKDVPVIPEDEFAVLLGARVAALRRVHLALVTRPQDPINRRMNAVLVEESSELEDFLDDYDARYNRRFVTLGELCASLRGFSLIYYALRQIENRYSRDGYLGDSEEGASHRLECAKALEFADRSLKRIVVALMTEIDQLCGHDDPAATMGGAIDDGQPARKLQHDLITGSAHDVATRLAREAAQYLAAVKTLEAHSEPTRFDDPREMSRYVIEICNEEQCRFFETKLHNILSRYDTFVKNSAEELDDVELPVFRHYVAATLLHLRVLTGLIHFYERHEDEIRSDEARRRVAELIDKDSVLDRALNFALFYAHRFLLAGLPIAEQIVRRYTTEESVTLTIPEGIQLHARPASLISQIVNHHGTPVEMSMGGDTCFAGSIMGVIMMVGKHLDERSVSFTGDRAPVADLKRLFEHRLGEDGLDRLPGELEYLRDRS